MEEFEEKQKKILASKNMTFEEKQRCLDWLMSDPSSQPLPKVTIHDTETQQLYSPFEGAAACLDWRSNTINKMGRSNSLTPPGSAAATPAVVSDSWLKPQRSNSLTPRSADGDFSARRYSYSSGVPASEYCLSSSGSYNELELMGSVTPQGPGMKDVPEWLKSLRLHKYTPILLRFTYDEMCALTDEDLDHLNVTTGARRKILVSIQKVLQRPQTLKKLHEDLTSKKTDVNTILLELESILMMPLKPHNSVQPVVPPAPSSAAVSSQPQLMKTKRHDSGSDSGTEHIDEVEDLGKDNVPGLIFNLLKDIWGEMMLSDATEIDNVAILLCQLERVRKQEAFTANQKQQFISWMKKLRAVWSDVPIIRRAGDLNKRRYTRDVSLRGSASFSGCTPSSSLRRASFQGRLPVGAPGFGPAPRGPAPATFHPATHHPQINVTTSHDLLLQRRSVPDIKPTINFQLKRNSYQGEQRIVDFGGETSDSLGLMPSFLDSGFGGFFPSMARRESAESRDSGLYLSLPDSRRSSALSGGSRRESTAWDDMSRRESFDSRRSSAISDYLSEVKTEAAPTHLAAPMDLPPPGSVSSGCGSDVGSTDSLLEPDLEKHMASLSLSVTEQALE